MSRWLKKAEPEQELPNELREWFATYRQSLPDSEASAGFMPGLWNKIESRQRAGSYWLNRLARQFVTAAFAMCLGLTAVLVLPIQTASLSPHTYVEVLDEAQSAPDDVELAESSGTGVNL